MKTEGEQRRTERGREGGREKEREREAERGGRERHTSSYARREENL